VGVNRVGLDGAQNEYSGNSAVYDVLGNAITAIKPNREQVEVAILERSHINFYRNKLKFLADMDAFNFTR
jgi:predicted amidohydrolase